MNLKYLLLFCLLTISKDLAFGQYSETGRLEGIKSKSIDPRAMSGRIAAMDIAINNLDLINVGSAPGGLLKTTNTGLSWKAIFEKETLLLTMDIHAKGCDLLTGTSGRAICITDDIKLWSELAKI